MGMAQISPSKYNTTPVTGIRYSHQRMHQHVWNLHQQKELPWEEKIEPDIAHRPAHLMQKHTGWISWKFFLCTPHMKKSKMVITDHHYCMQRKKLVTGTWDPLKVDSTLNKQQRNLFSPMKFDTWRTRRDTNHRIQRDARATTRRVVVKNRTYTTVQTIYYTCQEGKEGTLIIVIKYSVDKQVSGLVKISYNCRTSWKLESM